MLSGLLLAACTSGGPATIPATSPTIALPSFAIPSLAIPSFAIPSFRQDADLVTRFPAQIDGQPVTEIRSARYIDVLNVFAGADQIEQIRNAMSQVGLDLDSMSFASATATVGGEDVQIQALRTAGADANTFLQNYAALAQTLDPANHSDAPSLAQTNVGGKNVSTATDTDGSVAYLYVSGDVLWFINDAEESQAATVLAALP
jgi:hypothetical protein